MADPASDTTYPGSVDLLPTIAANDPMNASGLEHDVMHERAHAILNILQALVGTTADVAGGDSLLGRILALEATAGGSSARNAVTSVSIAAGVATVDVSASDYFTLVGSANATLAFSGLPGAGRGASVRIRYTQDTTGGRTLTLPASCRLTEGSDSAVKAGANAVSLIHATTDSNGSVWDVTIKGRGV
ncbi:hypothetical protein PQS31_06275 [Luteimonas sp BLCC-B24]|uniref:hypothetical protein n=1 Tax=Luteimonas sp. BLCC-B24 TaxID=3025317 RepID=UPI00234C3743|nr:hypothetical protein [Luteimonas sp. BLCC-B24]MDC7806430.1 hypothetical protein [Luteimonas sp. BLCC-B24]